MVSSKNRRTTSFLLRAINKRAQLRMQQLDDVHLRRASQTNSRGGIARARHRVCAAALQPHEPDAPP